MNLKFKGDEVTVDYSKKEVADFENLHLQIVRRPPDENCWSCHAMADGNRRGRQWNPEKDAHKAKGLHCLSCHPSDKEHNFAKGDFLQQTVRNDLNNSMHSCEDCHYKGKDKKAPDTDIPLPTSFEADRLSDLPYSLSDHPSRPRL
jgi:hypothetical protein